MAMQLILEASQTTNRVAGDGTTATVGLTYNLIKQAVEQVSGGHNPMNVRDTITQDSQLLLNALTDFTVEAKESQLEQVATVSAGDPALGKLIAEAVTHVGADGGIIAEKAYITGVEREYIEGYYLQEGFQQLSDGKKEIDNCVVIATAKKISSNTDFIELINRVVEITKEQPPRIAFIGEIEGQARESIIANIIQGKMDAVIVKTPSSGDMGVSYLEDIAMYTGGKVLSAGDSIKNIDETYIGRAQRIVCTPYTTSIFGGSHDKEIIDARVKEIKGRLDAEDSTSLIEKYRDRIAKLQGKIAIFRIGGATDTEKEEKEFRIEDAIQATKAARSEGIVAGGATTLLRLTETVGVSDMFKKALIETFKKLVSNANLSGDVVVHDVLNSKYPMGVNLRKDGTLVDLVKEGVLDPALTLQQIITNASSIAGNAITVECMILFEDKPDVATPNA